MGETFIPPEAAAADFKEKEFREVEGMRFEIGLENEAVERILGRIKSSHEKIASGQSIHKNEPLCYLEHQLIGSTADETLNPLKPNGLISGRLNIEDLENERNKRFPRGIASSFLTLDLAEAAKGRLVDSKGIKYDCPPRAQAELFEIIRQENGGEMPEDETLLYDLAVMNFNGQTGRLEMPRIRQVEMPDQRIVRLPESLSNQLAVKEVPVKLSNIFREKGDAGNDLENKASAFIDSSGWRFEAK